MLYAHDWLAFAHICLAILFAGAIRDPVRNVWIVPMRADLLRPRAGSRGDLHPATWHPVLLVLDRLRLRPGGGAAVGGGVVGYSEGGEGGNSKKGWEKLARVDDTEELATKNAENTKKRTVTGNTCASSRGMPRIDGSTRQGACQTQKQRHGKASLHKPHSFVFFAIFVANIYCDRTLCGWSALS